MGRRNCFTLKDIGRIRKAGAAGKAGNRTIPLADIDIMAIMIGIGGEVIILLVIGGLIGPVIAVKTDPVNIQNDRIEMQLVGAGSKRRCCNFIFRRYYIRIALISPGIRPASECSIRAVRRVDNGVYIKGIIGNNRLDKVNVRILFSLFCGVITEEIDIIFIKEAGIQLYRIIV